MEIIGIVQAPIPYGPVGGLFAFSLIFLICGIIAIKERAFGLDIFCGLLFGGLLITSIIMAVTPLYTITLDVSNATYMEMEWRMQGIEGYSPDSNGVIEITMDEDIFYEWCFINSDLHPEEFLPSGSKN